MLPNPNSYDDSKDYSILADWFALVDAKEETYRFFGETTVLVCTKW